MISFRLRKTFVISCLMITLLMSIQLCSYASLLIPNYPLDNYREVTANFGEYRVYDKANPPLVIGHEGIDLKESVGVNVYPVESGYAFWGELRSTSLGRNTRHFMGPDWVGEHNRDFKRS